MGKNFSKNFVIKKLYFCKVCKVAVLVHVLPKILYWSPSGENYWENYFIVYAKKGGSHCCSPLLFVFWLLVLFDWQSYLPLRRQQTCHLITSCMWLEDWVLSQSIHLAWQQKTSLEKGLPQKLKWKQLNKVQYIQTFEVQ